MIVVIWIALAALCIVWVYELFMVRSLTSIWTKQVLHHQTRYKVTGSDAVLGNFL